MTEPKQKYLLGDTVYAVIADTKSLDNLAESQVTAENFRVVLGWVVGALINRDGNVCYRVFSKELNAETLVDKISVFADKESAEKQLEHIVATQQKVRALIDELTGTPDFDIASMKAPESK